MVIFAQHHMHAELAPGRDMHRFVAINKEISHRHYLLEEQIMQQLQYLCS